MTEFQIRVDEESKTPEQIAQRDLTYAAARALRLIGYKVEVREFFTGTSKRADAAAIFIELGVLNTD